ncbi:hypothetical protein LWI29_025425 [Acer saccharum]|uniref:Uncharacterized protein n=1 Tax=Acer saccharum TaxID=4024 RepID=A0AA39V2S6_ACESA|nr:hypothetical protein LWI29_025425 [Acer saccharum]
MFSYVEVNGNTELLEIEKDVESGGDSDGYLKGYWSNHDERFGNESSEDEDPVQRMANGLLYNYLHFSGQEKNPHYRRSPSFSSSSSFSTSSPSSLGSSYFFPDESPLRSTPATPLRFFGKPFSWEHLPGVPKKNIHKKKEPTILNIKQLPLPPPVTPPSSKKHHFQDNIIGNSKKISTSSSESFRIKDPFVAALVECSKDDDDGDRDDHDDSSTSNFWSVGGNNKVGRSISDSVGNDSEEVVEVDDAREDGGVDRVRNEHRVDDEMNEVHGALAVVVVEEEDRVATDASSSQPAQGGGASSSQPLTMVQTQQQSQVTMHLG